MTKVCNNYEISKRPLDKLAQLVPENNLDNQTDLKKLGKRAKAKYFTNVYTKKLAILKSPLQKSYNNTIFGCSTKLLQTGKKLVGHYCNNRWCIVCNRIRTAKLINGYRQPLAELDNKHFVTLTVPNVPAETLRVTIKEMIKTFQNILKSLRKNNVVLRGIRKIECTYNPHTDTYHPHFHFIVENINHANQLRSEWLKRYCNAKIQAQDVKPADDGSMLELFKYFTKISTDKIIYINALDNIFQAMRSLRVFQPFGIHPISEDIEELIAETIEELQEAEKTWDWIDNDWIEVETGECLTGYEPDEIMKDMIKNIRQ